MLLRDTLRFVTGGEWKGVLPLDAFDARREMSAT